MTSIAMNLSPVSRLVSSRLSFCCLCALWSKTARRSNLPALIGCSCRGHPLPLTSTSSLPPVSVVCLRSLLPCAFLLRILGNGFQIFSCCASRRPPINPPRSQAPMQTVFGWPATVQRESGRGMCPLLPEELVLLATMCSVLCARC